jgi:methylated-DNA-[protein]-cysteine S-methyltransferase
MSPSVVKIKNYPSLKSFEVLKKKNKKSPLGNFSLNIYRLVRQIPRGKVTTYKNIALLLGLPNAARAVGNILKKNKNLIKVPCHRVIRSDGYLGGYILGNRKKTELLLKEGVLIERGKVNLAKFNYFGNKK